MMRLGCLFLAALSCAVASMPSKAGSRPELSTVVAASIDQHIIPGYTTLRHDTQTLHADLKTWCASGGGHGSHRDTVHQSFHVVISSWAAVSYLRFGPARRNSRQQRLAFFPDPRGVTVRQLGAALKRKDPALLEPGALASQSAALQGFPALEALLFERHEQGAATLEAYACSLAVAVSANVVALAQELADEWTSREGWRTLMTNPGADNPVYKNHKEAASELVKALLTGLQIVRDQGFETMLQAEEKGRTRIGLAFERSGLARQFLLGTTRSCAALAERLQLGDFVDANPQTTWMNGWITNAFRSLQSDIETMPMTTPGPMTAAGVSETPAKGTNLVRRGKFYSNGLRQIIGRQVAPTAGLTLGFNELDGD